MDFLSSTASVVPRRALSCAFFLCLVYLLHPGGRLSAQQLNAQFKGTVEDASGAPVADAQITAMNAQTGVTTSVQSKNDGNFEFLQLPVGTYNVSVVKTGFSTFKADRVTLVVNRIYSLPVRLEVGAVTATIEVAGNAIQVETTNTQLNNFIEAQKIVDLPLNGRNWI